MYRAKINRVLKKQREYDFVADKINKRYNAGVTLFVNSLPRYRQ